MSLLRSPALAVRLQAILGFIFIYASYHKIVEPPDFAHMVYNYKILPCSLINLSAIYLPWVELVSGVALLMGSFGRRGAASLVAGMLVVFMVALAYNLARGNAIDCGCFETSCPVPKNRDQLLGEMRWTIARDAGMLLMALQGLFARAPTAPPPPGAA